jgi:hypothetical protein
MLAIPQIISLRKAKENMRILFVYNISEKWKTSSK